MKTWFIQLLERYFKVWGVGFETRLPPEFLITQHARQRLKERMGVSDKKMQKLVVKAWYAKDAPESRLKFSKYNDQFRKQDKKIYKELMGYIFVFGVRYDFTRGGTQKRLITIYN